MSDRALAFAPLGALAVVSLAAITWSGATTGAITGVVRDGSTAAPVAGATVWLEIVEGGCPTTRTETDDAGRYVFSDLEPGRYRVRGSKNGYVARYHGEDDAPSFGREIVVGPGERRKAEVSLPLAGELSGHVREIDGRPMASGYVFYDNLSFANRSFHAVTDDEGYYWVSDLPPGDYRVSARRYSPSARQVVGERWFHPGTTDEQRAESVALGPGHPARVDILFGPEPAPTWSVRVQGPAGEPVPRAEVGLRRLTGKGDAPLPCRTDATGRCSRSLPAGEYEAFLALAPAAYGAGGAEAAGTRRFRVEPGSTSITEFRLGTGRSLTVVVRGRDDDPLPADHALRFTLARALPRSRGESDRRVEARPDGDAGFAFDGLGLGLVYRLEASSRDARRRYCVSALARGDEALDPARVVVSEDRASTIVVEVRRCAVLVGHTAAGAGAIVLRRLGGPALPEPLHPVELRVEPTAERFAFRGLPAGRYRIERSGASAVEIVLRPGEVRELPTLTALPNSPNI